MIFNTNQNRQLYVFDTVLGADEGINENSNLGEIQAVKTNAGQLFFKHLGRGGLTRSDLIDINKITSIVYTSATSMQRKLKTGTIKLSGDVNGGKPIPGQDYTLRVHINNYMAPGDACVLIRTAAVRATKDMNSTPALFYKALKKSLENNFKRDTNSLLKFSYEGTEVAPTGIVVTEVEQPWRLGVLSQEPVNFELYPTEVRLDGEDVVWGNVKYGTGKAVGNGKQIADLEYFCMGERGDMFRSMGWPNNIDVKYMVDSNKEYDVLNIHYAYSGNGVNVHKSEKDLTLVASSSKMTELKSKLTTDFGLTITEKAY